MPRILVTEAFKFAVDGNHVIEIEPGEQDVSERCAQVAVEHLKKATLVKGAAPSVTPPASVDGPVVPLASASPPVTPPAAAKPAVKPVAKPAAKPASKPAAKPKANAGGQ